MSILIFAHGFFGLIGIASGSISVAGMFFNKRMPFWNAVFLSTTTIACATGFVFLPIDGITSAQLVGFFLIALLAISAYVRYFRRLNSRWTPVYAFTSVGTLFLNILIATAQSFLHIPLLKSLAPTQQSPVYVAAKVTLLLVFVVIALVVARRASASEIITNEPREVSGV